MLNNQARILMTYQSLCFHLWTSGKDGYIQEEDVTKSKLQYMRTGVFSWKEKKQKETTNWNTDTVVAICKKKKKKNH